MKYQNIIDNMTLKEKAAFLSGKSEWQTRDFPRLDIPAIFCSDGPNGVRKQAGAGDHLGTIQQYRQPVFLQRQLWQTAGMKSWSRG